MCIGDAGKLDLASCRGFECSFLGEGGKEDRRGENLPSAWCWGAWGGKGGAVNGGGGLLLCQEVLSLLDGRDVISWGQRTGARLELFVLSPHPMDLRAPVCVCVALFFHLVFFSNNPLQGYRDIICQASRQSSFLLWDYIREHRLYYHFRTY